jgi:AraC-like DNA-binding protein
LRTFAPVNVAQAFPALTDIVEDIADWDIPDGAMARSTAVTVLPSTMPHLVVQYRTPVRSVRQFGHATHRYGAYRHVVTTVRNGVVLISPPGPLGVVMARLKPEAATRLLGDQLDAFADTKIDLDTVFGAGAVNTLAEICAEARSSRERIAAVLRFLAAHLRPRAPDLRVSRAAASLRQDPVLRLGPLAAELGLSERHLVRRFKAVYGVGPKRFARAARVEQVFAASAGGSSWANIACACGFADQAHMINDFKSILGVTPTDVFSRTASGRDFGSRTITA